VSWLIFLPFSAEDSGRDSLNETSAGRKITAQPTRQWSDHNEPSLKLAEGGVNSFRAIRFATALIAMVIIVES